MARSFDIDPAIVEVLQKAAITEDRVDLPEQLDRKVYMKVKKVLEEAGGKWNKKAQAHLFAVDPRTVLAQWLTEGRGINRVTDKQRYQQFFTPEPVADQMAALAKIQPGEKVLDPSCGSGRLLQAAMHTPGFLEHPESRIVGCELQADLVRALRQQQDTPSWEGEYPQHMAICQGDFLQWRPETCGTYDVILMNPPWTNGQDVRHVLHALDFLVPHGRLVAIMPVSVTWISRQSARAFRDLVIQHYGGVFTHLPDKTFHAEGTDVQAVILSCHNREQRLYHPHAPGLESMGQPHLTATFYKRLTPTSTQEPVAATEDKDLQQLRLL